MPDPPPSSLSFDQRATHPPPATRLIPALSSGPLHLRAVLGVYDSAIADLKAAGVQTLVAAGEDALHMPAILNPSKLAHQPPRHDH
jgi:hypothetical protein